MPADRPCARAGGEFHARWALRCVVLRCAAVPYAGTLGAAGGCPCSACRARASPAGAFPDAVAGAPRQAALRAAARLRRAATNPQAVRARPHPPILRETRRGLSGCGLQSGIKPVFCNENFCSAPDRLSGQRWQCRAGYLPKPPKSNLDRPRSTLGPDWANRRPAPCLCRFPTSSCPIRPCCPFCHPCRSAGTGPGRGPACRRCRLPCARGSNSARRPACRRA